MTDFSASEANERQVKGRAAWLDLSVYFELAIVACWVIFYNAKLGSNHRKTSIGDHGK